MKSTAKALNGAAPTEQRPRSAVWDSPQLMTAEQVGKVLQVPKSWVYEQSRAWVESDGTRGLPTVSLGRYRRFRPQAIRDYIERLERGEARV